MQVEKVILMKKGKQTGPNLFKTFCDISTLKVYGRSKLKLKDISRDILPN